jgi:hypothetical protein
MHVNTLPRFIYESNVPTEYQSNPTQRKDWRGRGRGACLSIIEAEFSYLIP